MLITTMAMTPLAATVLPVFLSTHLSKATTPAVAVAISMTLVPGLVASAPAASAVRLPASVRRAFAPAALSLTTRVPLPPLLVLPLLMLPALPVLLALPITVLASLLLLRQHWQPLLSITTVLVPAIACLLRALLLPLLFRMPEWLR